MTATDVRNDTRPMVLAGHELTAERRQFLEAQAAKRNRGLGVDPDHPALQHLLPAARGSSRRTAVGLVSTLTDHRPVPPTGRPAIKLPGEAGSALDQLTARLTRLGIDLPSGLEAAMAEHAELHRRLQVEPAQVRAAVPLPDAERRQKRADVARLLVDGHLSPEQAGVEMGRIDGQGRASAKAAHSALVAARRTAAGVAHRLIASHGEALYAAVGDAAADAVTLQASSARPIPDAEEAWTAAQEAGQLLRGWAVPTLPSLKATAAEWWAGWPLAVWAWRVANAKRPVVVASERIAGTKITVAWHSLPPLPSLTVPSGARSTAAPAWTQQAQTNSRIPTFFEVVQAADEWRPGVYTAAEVLAVVTEIRQAQGA